ncbi:Sec-independent protein translocase protein TatB [Hoeflea sp. CAU 1731]
MLDLGWQEFIVVALVLVLIVGPKDLPEMLRTFGKTTKKFRSMAGDFRKQFDAALKEAELDDVSSMISDARKFNPRNALKDVIDPLESAGRDIKAGLNEAAKSTGPTPSVAKSADTEKVTEKTQSAEPKATETSKKTAGGAAAKKPATRKSSTRKTAASGKAASTTTKSTTTKSASAKSASAKSASAKSKASGSAAAKSGSTKAAGGAAKTGAGSTKAAASTKPAASKTRKTTTRAKSAASKSKAAASAENAGAKKTAPGTASSGSGEKA